MILLLYLLAVLLAGCGVFRSDQRTEPSPAPPIVTQPVPTVAPATPSVALPAPTITRVVPTPAANVVRLLFGVQVVVQAGNAPTSLPSPAWLKSLNVETTVLWMYYPGTGENANAWIASQKQLVEQMVNGTGLQQIGVHIMPNPRPGTGPGSGPRFHMPADLTAYSAALTGLAQALQPHVRYYSIGNEFSLNIWGGTIDDYATLLQVSGQAIKAGNPNALILDSGIAGQNYVYPMAQRMVQQGNFEGTLQFIRAFLPHPSRPLPTNESQLRAALATAEAQSALSWFQALFTRLCPYYDVYQLHNYQGGATLPAVYDWIRSEMQAKQCVKPIQAWELGYSLDEQIALDDADQARTTAQIVTVSAGEGAQWITYFPLRTFTQYRGLATNEWQLLPAGVAFQTTTGKLSGFTQATRLSLGNNVSGYEFVKAAKKVYVVWSTANTSVRLPFQGGATLTDINGKATRTDSNNVAVGISPVFVEP